MKKDKQIILDYQEYLDMQSELDYLRKPADSELLTELEHQEATGILLVRALQNSALFRTGTGEIDLGKYKANFVSAKTQNEYLRIKFVRT